MTVRMLLGTKIPFQITFFMTVEILFFWVVMIEKINRHAL